CLIIKNAFSLDRCKFILGDLNEIMHLLSGPFDICLAIGILYHLEDPVAIIHRIAELADNLFVWTHYSTEDFPKGSLVKVESPKGFYRGKYVWENTKHYLSSLKERSFWIFEEDVTKVVKEAGFKQIELIQKEKHEHGPAMTFLAKK
ncbi:MAG: hypothetical protein NC820_05815, partial [Candidatus Omnitrophica bacterium]|nr:hypothetical protein [Candidatus Omnitrophota bacterium]